MRRGERGGRVNGRAAGRKGAEHAVSRQRRAVTNRYTAKAGGAGAGCTGKIRGKAGCVRGVTAERAGATAERAEIAAERENAASARVGRGESNKRSGGTCVR